MADTGLFFTGKCIFGRQFSRAQKRWPLSNQVYISPCVWYDLFSSGVFLPYFHMLILSLPLLGRPSSLGRWTANFVNEPRGKFARAYNPPNLKNITDSKICLWSEISWWFEQGLFLFFPGLFRKKKKQFWPNLREMFIGK